MSTTSISPYEQANPVWSTDRSLRPTAVGAATEPPDESARSFAVVVHDDEAHSYYDYVELFVRVFGYSERMAYQLTRAIDAAGRGVVWRGPLDDASTIAERVRAFRPEWRRNQSVTAPHRVESVVPPLCATIEPAEGVESQRGKADANDAESTWLERRVLSQINPRDLIGRPAEEIGRSVTEAIVSAGYRVPAEPSLRAVKNLLGRLFRIIKPAPRPVAAALTVDAVRPRRGSRSYGLR